MTYLIDTNVLSELRRKVPNAGVAEWFSKRPAKTLFVSVLTLGEIRKGIDVLPDSERKFVLHDWLNVDLPSFFNGRILTVDANVADRWGRLSAKAGRPIPVIDSLLAATAIHNGLKIVTRNDRDFEFTGLEVINPWKI
jgi:predicted nucleic acid-binding protein